MESKKVLIGCPVHTSKLYCWDEWVASIKSLKGEFDVLLVDNSNSNKISTMIDKSWNYINTSIDLPVREKVSFCQEFIRKWALEKGYEYLFMIEQDNIVAPDYLEYLISCNKKVVGIPYWKYEPDQKLNYMVWSELYKNNSGELQAFITPIMHVLERFDGKLHPVFNIGFGCLLIKRKVLKKFKFRVEANQEPHSDTYFGLDMFKRGIDVYASTSKVCKHLDIGLKKQKPTVKSKIMLGTIEYCVYQNPIESKKLFLSSLQERL